MIHLRGREVEAAGIEELRRLKVRGV